MNRSGFQLTLIAALAIMASIGLAAILSGLTPEDGLIAPPDDASQNSPDDSAIPDEGGDEPASPDAQGGLPGGNADAVKSGRLPGWEDKDVNSNPDKFFYLLSTDVTLESPGAEGQIMLENNPGNDCALQLCYYLEDTEELIYVSAMLQPGEHIEGDTLSKKLKKGDYKVNAAINVYDSDTVELKTTFHEEVNLTVNEKFLGIF